MREPNDENDARPLRIGSLFSGYGGLDIAVEEVFNARTIWFSEINEPVARVFSHHWPDAPNLGDITTIDWGRVEPVDVLCGGFPCQDVSTVGKMAGLAPGTRSGLWAHMATAVEALQPEWVVIENVRGLLSATAIRPSLKGDEDDRCNPEPATPTGAALRGVEPDPWGLGDQPARPLRALAPYSETWPTSGTTHDGSAYQLPPSVHRIPDSASSSSRDAPFRTPLASDSSRGGETLAQVRVRRGTIALSHQVIDLALHGPDGSANQNNESETLWSLIEDIFATGDATPQPSRDGNTSPGDPPLSQPS